MLIKGDNLTEKQRRLVLEAFGYRWTVENEARGNLWYGITNKPSTPLSTDEQWLKDHAFHFIKDGSRLCANRHFAEPSYLAD